MATIDRTQEFSHVINIYEREALQHLEKGSLYLSGVEALENEELIQNLHIDCVVSIIDKLTHNAYRIKERMRSLKIKHSKWIDLEDFDSDNIFPHLDAAHAYIKAMLPEHNVLLHCQLDMSKNASLVIAFLMKQYGEDYHHAPIYARNKRHITEPPADIEKRLKKFEKYLKRNHPHYFKRKQ